MRPQPKMERNKNSIQVKLLHCCSFHHFRDERFGAECFHSLLMCQQSELGLKQTSSLLFCFFGFHRCVQQLPPTSSQRRCGSNPTSSCSITASNPPKIHQKSTKNPPKVHPISPFSSPISIKLNQNSYLI